MPTSRTPRPSARLPPQPARPDPPAMILARIVGTVVATRKDPRLVSNKLLVARPLHPHGKAQGIGPVAVDAVDACVGEARLTVSGNTARVPSGMKACPVDAAVV